MTNQNRVDAGVPTGGQYAATAHSDEVPALGAQPPVRPHDPAAHARLLAQADRRAAAIDRMLSENDKLNMEAVSSGIRRDFPAATELRVKPHYGDRGTRLRPSLSGVRDKDGNDLTEGNPSWDYKPSSEGARPILYSFTEIRAAFFELENDFAYDQETGEIIVPLNRDYAEGIQD